MKTPSLLLISLVLITCTTQKQTEHASPTPDSAKVVLNTAPAKAGVVINLEQAKQKIEQNKNSLPEVTGNFGDFKRFVDGLGKFDLYSISTAAGYVREFLPKATPPGKDSTYLLFRHLFYTIANNQSDSLSLLYPGAIDKLEHGKKDQETQALADFFHLFGLGMFWSEGMIYLDVEAGYFLSLFEKEVSAAMKEYLVIRNQELEEGFSDDAALLISFKEVYDRVVRWENLINENPDFMLKAEANYYYQTYLATLLTGLDNTPAFDYESERLVPELKELYESIIKSGYDGRSTQIIKSYYEIIVDGDLVYSALLDEYLKENGLQTMRGVQPHLR